MIDGLSPLNERIQRGSFTHISNKILHAFDRLRGILQIENPNDRTPCTKLATEMSPNEPRPSSDEDRPGR
jgi:hypothetical protein